MRAAKGARWVTLAKFGYENSQVITIPYSLSEIKRLRKQGFRQIDDFRMKKVRQNDKYVKY